MNYIYIISIFLILNIIIISKSEEEELTLQNLLSWCKNNDIIISPKIEISFTNEGGINVTATEDIPQKTEIVSIPDKMILTVDKIISLLNSSELKAQYDNFQNLEVETYKPMNDELHKDEIFLTYLLYLMKHEKEKYKDTEFYKTFKELFLSVEKYKSNTPLLFTNEQKEFISGTYFGLYAQKIKKIIDKQINILKNSSFYNKDIDINDYIQKRLFVLNRAYNTSRVNLGDIILVPLFNLFPFDSLGSNAHLDFKYEQGAKIITTYPIKQGKQITVFSKAKSNVEKIVLEGRVNNNLVNYQEEYLIPCFSPYMYYKYDIDDIKLLENHYFNIFEMNFERKAPEFYKKHDEDFKEKNPTNLWACYMVQENLKYYKEYLEDLMKKINELFKGENEDKINTMNKALKGEWTGLYNKYEKMVDVCTFEKNKNKKRKKYIINEDL